MHSMKGNGKRHKKSCLSKDEAKKTEKSSTKAPRRKSTFKRSEMQENQNQSIQLNSNSKIQMSAKRIDDLSVLDNCEQMINTKLKRLKEKWEAILILENNLSNPPLTLKDKNIREIENNFYVAKISELQENIRKQESRISELMKENRKKPEQDDTVLENKRLKEQNTLLQRQNEILKKKLMENL